MTIPGEGFSNDPVQTLEMTEVPTVVAAMCEDCACPKPNATIALRLEQSDPYAMTPRTLGGPVLARALANDNQMPVSFSLTGGPEL